MPRKATNAAVETAATTDEAVVAVTVSVAGDEVDDTASAAPVKKRTTTKKAAAKAPLVDTDEIDVVSIIPNVSYKDSRTGDMYEWDEVGHVERMTVETLKNMWRNHKSYFRNLLLKPMDDRIINQFGLTNLFANYEYLMEESSYTKGNIDKICEAIANTPNGFKYAICNKIRSMVVSGALTDIHVIRALERQLDLDLTSYLE